INESQTQFTNDIRNIYYKAEENIDQQLKLNTDKLLNVVSDIKQSPDKHSSLNSEKLLSVVSEPTQSLDKHSSLIQEVLLEPQPRKKKSSMKIIREILNKKFFKINSFPFFCFFMNRNYYTDSEDDIFNPGIDLIVSLLALLLIV
ncbi:MAG: hypothetical protein O4965_19755, partial [Trichodesmium sp. St19_bin1]|nr:hypothetical protein [Trichodesmium sp. St19_bin1]